MSKGLTKIAIQFVMRIDHPKYNMSQQIELEQKFITRLGQRYSKAKAKKALNSARKMVELMGVNHVNASN